MIKSIIILLVLLASVPGSQGNYSFGMSVHKNHADTCDTSYDQEALKGIAVAIIEEHLYNGKGKADRKGGNDDRRRQLRGTVERDLTVRCDNGGYCLCPQGGGCGSFWCQWCTGRRRRLAVKKSDVDSETIEDEVKIAFGDYKTPTCWGPSVDIEVELY